MYCPSCGKNVPDNSKFCLHCGSSIIASSTETIVEWDNKDFVLEWKQGTGGKYYVNEQNSHNTNRLQVWSDTQSWILPKIQEWLDDGWQPVTEIGPSAISFRSTTGAIGYIFAVITFEVSEFRVKMRRPKRNPD